MMNDIADLPKKEGATTLLLVSQTSKANPVMAAVIKKSVTKVSARKLLKRQVVLLIGQPFCTVRFTGGLTEDSQIKFGYEASYAPKTVRKIKKGASKAEMQESCHIIWGFSLVLT